jgi:uracil-DNA glycosylase
MKTWQEFIQQEKQKEYYSVLFDKVDHCKKIYTVLPKSEDIFNAFKLTPLDKVKTVCLAQDPYHSLDKTGEPIAHGLAFSCRNTRQPSVQNIFKELKSDLGIENTSGDLTKWAQQGVLLLNTTLTVQQGLPNSHKDFGWTIFTDNAIKLLNQQDRPIVYLLWGKNAQDKSSLITNPKHSVLKAAHPSPYSASSGFFGCKHFSKTNQFLKENGIEEIDWKI